jgi:KDO2-lipid IV(A) lauroyltransferase
MNFLFLFIKLLASFLPKGLGDLIARGSARLLYTFIYKRGLSNHFLNLKNVFKDKSDEELLDISKKAAINLSISLYEQLVMGRVLNKRNYHKFLKEENIHNLYDAYQEGKGVVTLTAHLGNYEWGAALTCYLGFPLAVISVEYRTDFIRDLYERHRGRVGMRVFYIKKSFSEPFRFLKNGGVLAIVGDRSFEGSTLKVKMFGKETEIPKGAFFLASKLGIDIVPAFSLKEKDGLYHVYFEKPFKIQESEIALGIKKYIEILKRYIEKYPEQWFLFDKL